MRADGLILQACTLLVVGLCVWALVDALVRPAAAFPIAGKLAKPFWLVVTAVLGALTLVLGALSLAGMAGAVAAIVYLADVRPAVREIRSGGRWG
jgi:hypothetical protein